VIIHEPTKLSFRRISGDFYDIELFDKLSYYQILSSPYDALLITKYSIHSYNFFCSSLADACEFETSPANRLIRSAFTNDYQLINVLVQTNKMNVAIEALILIAKTIYFDPLI
jgi:hypothetical protein